MIAVTRPTEVLAYQYTAAGVEDFPARLVMDVLKVLPESIVLMTGGRIVSVEEGDWIVDDGNRLRVYTDAAFNNKFYVPGEKNYAV
jgi:hypothetical protein